MNDILGGTKSNRIQEKLIFYVYVYESPHYKDSSCTHLWSVCVGGYIFC